MWRPRTAPSAPWRWSAGTDSHSSLPRWQSPGSEEWERRLLPWPLQEPASLRRPRPSVPLASGETVGQKGRLGSHLKHHVTSKEHPNHIPSYDAVPDKGPILIWVLWVDAGGGVRLTFLESSGSTGLFWLMLSAVWLTIEVITRFILIWEGVKSVKYFKINSLEDSHPQCVVEDKSNECQASEDVSNRDQRNHFDANE